jgi:hypothetical protein
VAGFSFFLEPLSLIGYLEPKRGRLVALVAGWFFNLLQNMSTNQVLFLKKLLTKNTYIQQQWLAEPRWGYVAQSFCQPLAP